VSRFGGIAVCFPILASLASSDPEGSGDSARHDKKSFCAYTVHARDTAAAFQPPFGLKSAIGKSPLLVSLLRAHEIVSYEKQPKLGHLPKFLAIHRTVSAKGAHGCESSGAECGIDPGAFGPA
jgi:hypothetical protein